MTDELPEIFDQIKPRPAPRELRGGVLAAVERELASRRKPVWERALEIGVAASLVLGIGLNVWQWRSGASWQQPVDRSSAEFALTRLQTGDVASSDADVDQLIHDRLVMLGPRRELQAPISQQYERLLKELTKPGSG
jgi:hypothetical protein